MEEKNCEICKRQGKKSLCDYHAKAYYNIVKNYEYWRDAYDELCWEEYLMKLIVNSECGKWVKEVAKYLISKKIKRLDI
ncbi:MAG: hypothetical protein H5T50_08430 [Nitrososphaeria archaeon]|nr:hypothetical protein [Nitrososphaeria archaeon]